MCDEMHENPRPMNKPSKEHTHKIWNLNKRVEMLMNNAFSYVIILDRDAKILQYSESLLDFLRIADGSTLVGSPITASYILSGNVDFAKETDRRLLRIMSGEDEFYEDDAVLCPTGEKRIFRITYKRLFDEDGVFDGTLIYAQDFTNLRLEEAKRRVNDLLRSTMLPCLIWDEKGDIIAYNDEAARVFGIPEGTSMECCNRIFLSRQPVQQPDGSVSETLRHGVLNEALEKGFSQITVQLEINNRTYTYFTINVTRISWLFGYRLVVYFYDLTEIMAKEAKAKEAEERMRLMLDTNPLCCSFWDMQHNMIDCNEETARVFDLPDKQTFINDFFKLSPERQPDGQLSRDKAAYFLNETFEKGRMVFEWMHQSLDGEPIPAEVTLVRLKRDGESIVAGYTVLGYVRDLREHKRMMAEADEANARIKLMLDINPLICIMRDDKGNIIDCNQEALNVLGVPDKEEFCKNFSSFFPEYQPDGSSSIEKMGEIIRILDEKGVVNLERTFLTPAGELIPVESKIVRIPWKNTHHYISFSRDLRETKANEQKMLEITQREREAKIQSEAALAANEAKSQFLARMSHEIRTPMNSIIGFSELAMDDNISPKTKDYLEQILENSSWLLQIINDLLDISKIESGRMEVERIPLNLDDVFSYCKSAVAPKAIDKNLSLIIGSKSTLDKNIIGDPTKLRQVLLNLLANAVKFTDSGTVQLEYNIVKSTDSSVTIRFYVKDSGIGIKPDQIKKIFEPFSQADISITRKYGGTGLGLPITNNLLELMGSRLEVESTPGVGSVFSFELTFETTNIRSESYRLMNTDFGIKKPVFTGIILVCEDNRMNQRVITEHLERVGIQVVMADNGKEGVEKVRNRKESGEKPFDLIFMDVHMPVMDGLQAAPLIMQMKTGTPIVAMTASIMTDDINNYRVLGFNDHVGKPFTSQELWFCLLKYIKPVNFQSVGVTENNENEQLQKKLKTEFVKDNQVKYDEIKNAIDSGDIELAHRLAHSLKSNAAMIGRLSLQKAAANIEASLKGGVNRSTEEQVNTLRIELQTALDEMASYKETTGAERFRKSTAGEFDALKARELIEKLEPLLNSGNPECLNLVEDLSLIPGSDELIQQIEDFCFNDALELLIKIKGKVLNDAK